MKLYAWNKVEQEFWKRWDYFQAPIIPTASYIDLIRFIGNRTDSIIVSHQRVYKEVGWKALI